MVKEGTCVVDIETDSLNPSLIHCAVVLDLDTGKHRHFESGAGKYAEQYILSFGRVVAHNGCSFDFPALKNLWNIEIPFERQWDTLILSRLSVPDREGGHSLESWGHRLAFPKLEYSGGFEQYSPEMLEYCRSDAVLCGKIFNHLRTEMSEFDRDAVRDEHRMQILANKVQNRGFAFDVKQALDLYSDLKKEEDQIVAEMQSIFPPTEVQLKTKTKYIPFNPASRQHIAERLIKLGWKPSVFTETGLPKVDENTLDGVQIKEAKVLARYFMLLKRTGMLNSWIKACRYDNRVRATYHTLGAVTNRMSCSGPNLQQIPSTRKPYGVECRSLWKAKSENVLVDADAKGLELRVLANYMGDPEFTRELLTGDVHTANQRMAGLETRDQAKTFIYALLYGAGDAKIGKIVGGSERDGSALRDRFLSNMPAYDRFQSAVVRKARKFGVLTAIDGRILRVRSPHAAVNTLIQGSSAVLMKKWFLYTDFLLETHGVDAGIVAMVHDELVLETNKNMVDLTSDCVKVALEKVVEKYNLTCPLDCDIKVGNNWSEIH
jgi:DNA polymerase-1